MNKPPYPIKLFADLVNSKPVKQAYFKGLSFIVMGIILCMLVFCLQPRKHQKQQQTKAKLAASTTAKTLLMQNLHYIRQQSIPGVKSHHSPTKPVLAMVNAELTARYNAPMDMYHADKQQQSSSFATLQQKSALADFINRKTRAQNVHAQRIQHPDYTVVSGELMHAVLESSIQSDLPGQVRALVSEPVYAYISQRILVPKGSRLIGQYHTVTSKSQQRVMIVWNRLVLPSGISVQIDSGSVDEQGRSGQSADTVNRHFWQRFGQASLLSLIGTGAATASVSDYDQYNSLAQYRSSVAQSFQHSANQAFQHDSDSKPTLTINAGAQINVFVARDIDMTDVMLNVGAHDGI